MGNKFNHREVVSDLRQIIGDSYYDNGRRGAKTNELGLTKSQVIALAEELAMYMEGKTNG